MGLQKERSNIEVSENLGPALAGQGLHHVIDQIERDLRRLEEQRATIVKRIAMMKRTIAGLGTLFGSGVIDEQLRKTPAPRCSPDYPPRLGLTNCCRQLLKTRRSALTLHEIVKACREQYPQIYAAQSHPENSLRTILRRLVLYGEAIETRSASGLRTWQATSTGALSEDVPDPKAVQAVQGGVSVVLSR